MAAIIQYDLFQPKPTPEQELRIEMKQTKESCDKVRKKLFAENNAIKKDLFELKNEMEILKRGICKGTLQLANGF